MADLLTPDLCVIGAGPAGLSAAVAARALGGTVVVIERDRFGGRGLYSGALPAQALLASAAHARAMRTASAFGIASEEPRINFRKVHDHLHQVVAATAPAVSAERLQALGVQVLKAEAKFTDARTVTAGDTLVRARRFVIATGARPAVPPIPGLNTVAYFTPETIFDNTRKLTHLVVIGAGAAGIELAQAYHRLGSHVTLVDTAEPLAGFDPELAEIALRRLRGEGVDIRGGTEVTLIQSRSMGIGVGLKRGEQEEMLDASHILVAGGWLPNLDSLDLGKAGIRRQKADPSRLELDSRQRTSNRRVYGVGDAAGGQSLQQAEHEAAAVARHALLGIAAGRRRATIPTLVYADPEIAEIGLAEPEARRKHGDRFRVLRASYAGNERATAARQGYGLVKLLTGRDGTVLGAGVVGPAAGELIALFAIAVDRRFNAAELGRFAAPYPSFSDLVYRLGAAFSAEVEATAFSQRLVRLNRLLP